MVFSRSSLWSGLDCWRINRKLRSWVGSLLPSSDAEFFRRRHHHHRTIFFHPAHPLSETRDDEARKKGHSWRWKVRSIIRALLTSFEFYLRGSEVELETLKEFLSTRFLPLVLSNSWNAISGDWKGKNDLDRSIYDYTMTLSLLWLHV